MEMGMGKTLTSMSHALDNRENGPTLVIVSKTLMGMWKEQGNQFYDGVKILFLHKDYHKGARTPYETIGYNELRKYHLVVTTYDVCVGLYKNMGIEFLIAVKDNGNIIGINHRRKPNLQRAKKTRGVEHIYRYRWNRIIFDESQRFCNPETTVFRAMMGIYADKKWCLTGTPIRNHALDLWSQLRVCGYDGVTKRHWSFDIFAEENLERVLFEGTYERFGIEMPKLHIHDHHVDFEERQETLYQDVLQATQSTFTKSLMKSASYTEVLAMLTYLRQICVAPYILEGDDSKTVERSKDAIREWITDREGPAGIDSPKIRKIVELVKAVPEGEKVLIFSMFTSCLDIASEAISIDCPELLQLTLDGRTSMNDREAIIQEFKSDPTVKVMLVNYRVGSEGLNLTCANHIICIEPWWTFATHEQAISRCWRLGQTKPVHVNWVIMKESVECGIHKMCEEKREIAATFSQLQVTDNKRNKTSGLNMVDMRKLLYTKKTLEPELTINLKPIFNFEGDCPICYEKAENPHTTDCGHVFCKNCIGRWLVTGKKECPSCRTELKK